MNKEDIFLVLFMILLVIVCDSFAVYGSQKVFKEGKSQGKIIDSNWLWFECVDREKSPHI